jgi:hypothetical protein
VVWTINVHKLNGDPIDFFGDLWVSEKHVFSGDPVICQSVLYHEIQVAGELIGTQQAYVFKQEK